MCQAIDIKADDHRLRLVSKREEKPHAEVRPELFISQRRERIFFGGWTIAFC